MSTLANQLAKIEREEVGRAIRALLARPLVTAAADPEMFDLIRRRRGLIAAWFERHCGWMLNVEPRHGYVRLIKIRTDPDPSRPARRLRSSRAPFDRRRYVLFCLTCAELLAAPATTIGLLSRRITQAAAADPALPPFDTSRREERRAYVDALKLLEHYGILRAVDGLTDSYIDQQEAKVLYSVDTTRLLRLLASPTAPSRLDSFDLPTLLREPRYGAAADTPDEVSDAQRNLWLRHSILRRLVDDPVVYYTDLTPEQRGYLASPTGRQLVRQACEQAGFVLEERAEGLLAVDPDGLATDTKFPDDASHTKVAALLLLDLITGSPGPTPMPELVAAAGRMLDRFRTWAKAYQSEDGPTRLAADALAVLRAFGLITETAVGVAALPAAYRYATDGPIEESA